MDHRNFIMKQQQQQQQQQLYQNQNPYLHQQQFRQGYNMDSLKKKAVVISNNKESIEKLFGYGFNGSISELKLKLSELNIPFHYTKENGETLIHQILRTSDLPEFKIYNFIKYCILKGTPVDLHDDQGITPLHLASKSQYLKIIELLLEYGADPKSVDLQNMNAAHYAVQGKIIKCIGQKRIKQISENKNDKLINELTNFIIKQFKSDDQNIIIIKNLFQNLYTIYEHDIDYIFNDFLLKIQKIIENESISEDDKKRQLQIEKKNIMDDLIYKITNDLSLTYQNIKINPNLYINSHEFEQNNNIFSHEIYNYDENNDKENKKNKNKNKKKQKGGVFEIASVQDFNDILDQKNVNDEIIKYISELEKNEEIILKNIITFQNKISDMKNELKKYTLNSYENIFSIYQVYTYMFYNSYFAIDDDFDLQVLLNNINNKLRNIAPIKKSRLLNLTDYANRREILNEIKKNDLSYINNFKTKLTNVTADFEEKNYFNLISDIDIYIHLFDKLYNYYYENAQNNTYINIPGGQNQIANLPELTQPIIRFSGGPNVVLFPITSSNLYTFLNYIGNIIHNPALHHVFPLQQTFYNISYNFIFSMVFMILKNECTNIKSIINKISKNNVYLIKILTSVHIKNINELCGISNFLQNLLGKNSNDIIKSNTKFVNNILKHILNMYNMKNLDYHIFLLKMYCSVVFDEINEDSFSGKDVENAIYGNSYMFLNIIDGPVPFGLFGVHEIITAVERLINHPPLGPNLRVNAGRIMPVNVDNVANNVDGYIDYILTIFYKIKTTDDIFYKLKNDMKTSMTEQNLQQIFKKLYSLVQIDTFFINVNINIDIIKNLFISLFDNVLRTFNNPENKPFNINMINYIFLFSLDQHVDKTIINMDNIKKIITDIDIYEDSKNITIFNDIFFENIYNDIKKLSKIGTYLPPNNLSQICKQNIVKIADYKLLQTDIDDTYSQRFLLQNILQLIFLSIEYEENLPIDPNNTFQNNINNSIILEISFHITVFCFIFYDLIKSCTGILRNLDLPLSIDVLNEIENVRINIDLFNNMTTHHLQNNYILESMTALLLNNVFNQMENIITTKIAQINGIINANFLNILQLPNFTLVPVPPSPYINSITNMVQKYQKIIGESIQNIDILTPLNIKLNKILNNFVKQNIIQQRILNEINKINILDKINGTINISSINKLINREQINHEIHIYFAKKFGRGFGNPARTQEIIDIPNNLQTSIKMMSILSKSSNLSLKFTDLYLNIDLSYDMINIIIDNINKINILLADVINEKNIKKTMEIFVEIYYSILDTLQYISYLKKNEHVKLTNELNELILIITDDEKKRINNMYKISLSNIKNYISAIIYNLNEIDNFFQKIYKELYNLVIILNKKILIINKTASLHFLGAHIKDNEYLNKKIPKIYNNIFAKILPMLKTLPSDFLTFMSFFTDINYEDEKIENVINESNKKMYEEHMLYISNENYNIYLSNDTQQIKWRNGYYMEMDDIRFPNKQTILNYLKNKTEKKNYFGKINQKKTINIPHAAILNEQNIIQNAGMNFSSGIFGVSKINENQFLYETSKYTIDIFLFYLKNMMINNLDTNDKSYDDMIFKLSQNINIHQNFGKYVVSILFYNKCNNFISTYIKNLAHSSCVKLINGLLLQNMQYNIKIENNLLLSDIIYEFELSNTYFELKNEYADFIEQSLHKNTNDNIHNKNIIYESFSFFDENIMSQTFHVDEKIIDILMEEGCKFDWCDNSDLSPIFYSIDMLDINTTKKIIDSDQFIKQKNIIGNSRSFDFCYEMFDDFIELNNIILPIQYTHTSGIIREIPLKKHIFLFKTNEFYNNLILSLEQTILDMGLPTYIDNIFDMMIMLYNHQFYLYAKYKNFIKGGWTKNNFNILIALFINNNFNIHDIGFENPILNYFNYNISYNEIYTNNSYIELLKDQINNLQIQISIINQYKVEQPSITNDADIDIINKKIQKLKKELNKINIKKLDVDIHNTIIIKKTNKISNIFNIDKLYDVFVDNFIENKIIRYNKIWKKYINTNKESDVFNISNILTCFANFGYNFKNISKNDMEIFINLYESLVVYLLDDLRTKSLFYNSNNLVLTDIINIMAHVVKYIICSKLYSSIMQIFIDDIKNRSNDEYMHIFKHIMEQNESKELKKCILEILPLKIIKFHLNIYEQNETKIEDLKDFISENIMNIINMLDYATDDVQFKNNITNIINHYILIIEIFVPKMKEIMDLYNCYLMNFFKYIKILEILN